MSATRYFNQRGEEYTLPPEDQSAQDEMVTVVFQTRADLQDLSDDDLIATGRFVQECARAARARL